MLERKSPSRMAATVLSRNSWKSRISKMVERKVLAIVSD